MHKVFSQIPKNTIILYFSDRTVFKKAIQTFSCTDLKYKSQGRQRTSPPPPSTHSLQKYPNKSPLQVPVALGVYERLAMC